MKKVWRVLVVVCLFFFGHHSLALIKVSAVSFTNITCNNAACSNSSPGMFTAAQSASGITFNFIGFSGTGGAAASRFHLDSSSTSTDFNNACVSLGGTYYPTFQGNNVNRCIFSFLPTSPLTITNLPSDRYRVSLNVADGAGNYCYTWTTPSCGVGDLYFYVDGAAPSLTLNNSNATFYNTARATVTAIDALTGLNTIRYAWSTSTTNPANISTTACSGGTSFTGFTVGQTSAWTSGVLTPANQGINYLHVCAVDRTGNIQKTYAQYNYDSTKPTVSLTNSSNTWYAGNRTSVVSASDSGGSGLGGVRYFVGATNPFTSLSTCQSNGAATSNGATLTISTTGGTTLWLCAYDNAGNYQTASGTFNIDKTLPTLSATNSSDNWFNTQRTGVINVSDTGGSGLVEARYSWGSNTLNAACSSGGTVVTNGTSLNAAASGTTLYLCARDNAGNVQTWNGNYRWENTPPVCGNTWTSTPASNVWLNTNTSRIFTLSGSTDTGGSGINTAGGACTAGANHGQSCTVTISDHAGNTTVCTSPSNLVDTLSPSIAASGATGSNWLNTDPSPIISALDPAASGGSGSSGIVEVRYAFVAGVNPVSPLDSSCTNGGGVLPLDHLSSGSNPTPLVTPQGGVTLFLCVRDAASNVGVNQGRYNWEDTIPSISLTENPPVPVSGYYDDASPIITLTAADNGGAGIAGVRFQWNTAFNPTDPATGNLTWRSNHSTTTLPNSGIHTLYYQALDNAGNVSLVESKQYILNADIPTQEVVRTTAPTLGHNGWVTTPPSYQITGRFSVAGNPADDQVSGIYLEQVVGNRDLSFTYASFSASAFHDLSTLPPPKQVSFTPLEGVSTAYYGVAASSKLSTLESTTTMLDSKSPTGYFIISSPTGGPINNQLAMHYSISDPLTGNFLDVTSGNPDSDLSHTGYGPHRTGSTQNSGLALCEIQAASAPVNPDGTIGSYTPFSTILSVANCGTQQATNSALLFTDYTASLVPGHSYLFHLNFVDEAGNTGQLPLLSATGEELTSTTPPIISSFPPTITLDPTLINQDFLITPTSFQQVEPGTTTHPPHTLFTDQVVFKGTITDLDIGNDLTVSLIIRNPHDLNDILFTKETTLISNGGGSGAGGGTGVGGSGIGGASNSATSSGQFWQIPVTFSELKQVITDSSGALTSPLSNFEFKAFDGTSTSLESVFYLGELTLATPPSLTNPAFTTDINPATCPAAHPTTGATFTPDLCLGALASFSAVISDPDGDPLLSPQASQPLTFRVIVTSPLSHQSLSKDINVGHSPLTNVTTNPLTFNYAELLSLGETLNLTYLVDDGVTLTRVEGPALSLYPASQLISSLQPQIDTRFASTIYIKDPSSLISQGFLKIKDLDHHYQVWTHPLYLYHFSTSSSPATPNPYPHPFLVKTITNPQLGILKLKGR